MSRYDTSPPSCPGCTVSGGLTLLQAGRANPVSGLEARPDLWGCLACGWEGWGLDTPLGIQVQVLDPETGHVSTPASDIQQCWDEQEGMEVERGGGGGAKGRRNPKPGDKRQRGRVEQDSVLLSRDRAVTVERRSVVRTFRFTPTTIAFLEREAQATRVPVQSLLDDALALWAQQRFCVELS